MRTVNSIVIFLCNSITIKRNGHINAIFNKLKVKIFCDLYRVSQVSEIMYLRVCRDIIESIEDLHRTDVWLKP